ncbi:YihY family inner membrane protein [Sulfurimonas sp. MAG313]|nr:YihY/virulence factor BrkB family protein [Sulfurimonas sp. MAG313]MDF1882237.1 YihY family inner membrane protein [Sulfurimonas sp. MAG313]
MSAPINISKQLKQIKISYRIVRTYFTSLFDRDITFYASSLSFYTLFTLVPVMLIVLSISTSLASFDAFYGNVKEFIMANIVPVKSESFSLFIDSFMQNSVQLSIMGVIAIIVSSMLFFQNYEYIVNKIFKTKPRGFWQSLSIYWTLLTLTPIALIFSFYLSNELNMYLNKNDLANALKILEFFPYLIVWSLFFLIYKISANADVSNRAAGISSFAISLTWYVAKIGFITYILNKNPTYATIYGSFSTLIFFFLWIYVSWLIFIYGLKLCYTIEKVYKDTHTEEKKRIKEESILRGQDTDEEIQNEDFEGDKDSSDLYIQTQEPDEESIQDSTKTQEVHQQGERIEEDK